MSQTQSPLEIKHEWINSSWGTNVFKDWVTVLIWIHLHVHVLFIYFKSCRVYSVVGAASANVSMFLITPCSNPVALNQHRHVSAQINPSRGNNLIIYPTLIQSITERGGRKEETRSKLTSNQFFKLDFTAGNESSESWNFNMMPNNRLSYSQTHTGLHCFQHIFQDTRVKTRRKSVFYTSVSPVLNTFCH